MSEQYHLAAVVGLRTVIQLALARELRDACMMPSARAIRVRSPAVEAAAAVARQVEAVAVAVVVAAASSARCRRPGRRA